MIHKLICAPLQENSYLITDKDKAICIDPGDGQYILEYCKNNHLFITDILLTHGHFDHIEGVQDIVNTYHSKTHCSLETNHMIKDSYLNLSNSFTIDEPTIEIKDDIHLLSYDIKVYHTPGHTDGDVLYYFKDINALFTGDTLFYHSIGRTDFPTSSYSNMNKSLTFIKQLDFDAVIYPGHGQNSTLKDEQKYNPFLLNLRNF